MSYDLFFESRSGGKPINAETFGEYFGNRSNYQVNGSVQAWYSNEDSGVYFSFTLDRNDGEGPAFDATFNVNLYRPHIFGLEAEIEVASFVAAFNPVITDPQDGIIGGVYSREQFLTGWNASNRFAYRAVDAGPTGLPPCLSPAATIERVWRWNFLRADRQRKLGDSIFVPKIIFLKRGDAIYSMCVWGDLTATHLPDVDFILVVREHFASKNGAKPDFTLVRMADLVLLILPAKRQENGQIYYALADSPSSQLISWIRALRGDQPTKDAISVDQVLDREIWNEARDSLGA